MTPVQTTPLLAAPSSTCPLCHTPGPLSIQALLSGGSWACSRCGQTWTAERLETAAAYARFTQQRLQLVGAGLAAGETIH